MKQLVIFPLLLLFVCFSPAKAQDVVSAKPLSPAVAPKLAAIEKALPQGPFKPEWDSLSEYEIPQWYKDAKLGIFIHWGVYAVPAYGSEWYPRNMYINKEGWAGKVFRHHKETYGDLSRFGYKDFIPMFKAEKFDAAAWSKLFKDSGARYVVPVAEHHDGFPMYDCSFTEWDASEMGPKRDLIAELEKAIRAEGMKFGVSSHRAFNWSYYLRSKDYDNADLKYAGLYGRPLPFLFREEAVNYKGSNPTQDDTFKDDWLARTCELVDKYNPDLIWFDFGIAMKQDLPYDQNPFAPHLKKFAAYYYNQRAKHSDDFGIINYKWNAFPEKAAVLDKERSKMAEIRKPFWQTDTAVSSSSWGYTKDQQYKTPDRLVDDLVDIVSKNGCLLLNVGPRADGTIPDEDQAILKAIGGWLKINGESIYDTTYWKTFGEGPTAVSTGHVSENKDKPFTSEDVRFTAKDDVVYATLLAWPETGTAVIRTLRAGAEDWPGEIESIELLGSDQKLTWTRTNEAVTVELPSEKPCDFAYVLKIR
ncbi:alpha-L-fucosidase [Novipirellula artificiosorum]